MKLEHRVSLPYNDRTIVKQYLTVLKADVKYPAFTVNDRLELEECQGIIGNNGSYNYHNNYDDSEDELQIIYPNGSRVRRWFTLNKQDALDVQAENIRAWREIIKEELLRLETI